MWAFGVCIGLDLHQAGPAGNSAAATSENFSVRRKTGLLALPTGWGPPQFLGVPELVARQMFQRQGPIDGGPTAWDDPRPWSDRKLHQHGPGWAMPVQEVLAWCTDTGTYSGTAWHHRRLKDEGAQFTTPGSTRNTTAPADQRKLAAGAASTSRVRLAVTRITTGRSSGEPRGAGLP